MASENPGFPPGATTCRASGTREKAASKGLCENAGDMAKREGRKRIRGPVVGPAPSPVIAVQIREPATRFRRGMSILAHDSFLGIGFDAA